MGGKDNIKQAVDQIKIIKASKAVTANYDSDTSANLPCKNKTRTSALTDHKQQGTKKSIIKALKVTACYERRLKLLSASINNI